MKPVYLLFFCLSYFCLSYNSYSAWSLFSVTSGSSVFSIAGGASLLSGTSVFSVLSGASGVSLLNAYKVLSALGLSSKSSDYEDPKEISEDLRKYVNFIENIHTLKKHRVPESWNWMDIKYSDEDYMKYAQKNMNLDPSCKVTIKDSFLKDKFGMETVADIETASDLLMVLKERIGKKKLNILDIRAGRGWWAQAIKEVDPCTTVVATDVNGYSLEKGSSPGSLTEVLKKDYKEAIKDYGGDADVLFANFGNSDNHPEFLEALKQWPDDKPIIIVSEKMKSSHHSDLNESSLLIPYKALWAQYQDPKSNGLLNNDGFYLCSKDDFVHEVDESP